MLLEIFAHLRREFVQVLENTIGRAVFFDEFDGGLFTDAGDAGDVVGVVAHECLDFDRLGGRVAVFLGHFRFVDDFIASADRTCACRE